MRGREGKGGDERERVRGREGKGGDAHHFSSLAGGNAELLQPGLSGSDGRSDLASEENEEEKFKENDSVK